MSDEWWKIQSLFLLGEGLGHLFEHKSRSIISGNKRTKWAASLKKHVNNSFWYHTLFNESNGANVVKLRLIRQKMDSSTLPINVDTYRYATEALDLVWPQYLTQIQPMYYSGYPEVSYKYPSFLFCPAIIFCNQF